MGKVNDNLLLEYLLDNKFIVKQQRIKEPEMFLI